MIQVRLCEKLIQRKKYFADCIENEDIQTLLRRNIDGSYCTEERYKQRLSYLYEIKPFMKHWTWSNSKNTT